jgi:hypothetical protein
MRYALTFVFAMRLAAAAEHDPSEVLSRAAVKVLAGIRHIPDCTCEETVSRQYFRPAVKSVPRACEIVLEARRQSTVDKGLRRIATDRLRLDVAMTEYGEIFSWVGASKFDDEFIDLMARNGPIGTGFFGSILAVIFESDVKKLNFAGNKVVEGRSVFEYGFQVAQPDSHYRVKVGDSWVFTAYDGTVQVDPETDDLVRITVATAQLPQAAGECFSVSSMQFGMVQIGDAPVLLPKLSHQRFVSPNGGEVENTTEFANCREYKGESTVTFEEDPPAPGNLIRSTPEKTISVPAGSRFSFELTQPISSDVAAGGDRFIGRLIQPLRDPGRQVLAPKGALVEGRMLRVLSFHLASEVIVVLRPDTLEIDGSKVPLTAVPDRSQAMMRARIEDRKKMAISLPQPGEEHSGIFRFPGEHAKIPKGFQSDWLTVAAK